MYKEIVISIIVIGILTFLDIFTQSFTNETIEYMEQELSSLRQNLVEENNSEQVKTKMEEIFDVWKENK